MTRRLRIAFDVGGVLSKYPDQFRALVAILAPFCEIHVITDMHKHDEVCETLKLNGFDIDPKNVHCADYTTHGEGCKAELLCELKIDFFVDDFIGYAAEPGGAAIRLLLMPDASKPYWHETWKTVSESDFGRRVYRRSPKNES
jgi:hypothetical protein